MVRLALVARQAPADREELPDRKARKVMWGRLGLPVLQVRQACVAPPVLQVQLGRKDLRVILGQLARLGRKAILARKARLDLLARKGQ